MTLLAENYKNMRPVDRVLISDFLWRGCTVLWTLVHILLCSYYIVLLSLLWIGILSSWSRGIKSMFFSRFTHCIAECTCSEYLPSESLIHHTASTRQKTPMAWCQAFQIQQKLSLMSDFPRWLFLCLRDLA